MTHDPNAVLNPDSRIMEVLLGLMGWAHKTYVYPSQLKILQLVRDFTGRRMSRRSLCRHLRALERDGHLRRCRRLTERPAEVLHIRTTLYWPRGRYLARAQRLARGLMGWSKARTQRDAARALTRHQAAAAIAPTPPRPRAPP